MHRLAVIGDILYGWLPSLLHTFFAMLFILWIA